MEPRIAKLDYQARPAEQGLTLERHAGGATLLLPVEPVWVHWVTVGGAFFNMTLAMAALLLLSPPMSWGRSTWWAGGVELLFVCSALGLEAAVLGLIGAFELISARGCRGQRRQIGFCNAEVFSIQPGWKGMVHQRWRLTDIRQIRTHCHRSFFSEQPAIRIRIKMTGQWFGIHATAAGEDREAAIAFAKLLEEVVLRHGGIPFTCRYCRRAGETAV